MAQGWRDADAGVTAATFAATLRSENLCVVVSEETASQILMHNGAAPLKQVQTIVTEEYRGLTYAAANQLLGLQSDGTTMTIYYAQRESSDGGVAQYVAAAARTGSTVNVTTSRVSDAANYNVRVTTTTYSADGGADWTTTRPSASSSGVTVSKTKRTIITQYPSGVKAQEVTTTVVEYPFLTQSEANTLCTSSNSMSASRSAYTATRTVYTATNSSVAQTYTGYYTFYVGTIVSSTMRYIDEANGWTVTKTTEVTGA